MNLSAYGLAWLGCRLKDVPVPCMDNSVKIGTTWNRKKAKFFLRHLRNCSTSYVGMFADVDIRHVLPKYGRYFLAHSVYRPTVKITQC